MTIWRGGLRAAVHGSELEQAQAYRATLRELENRIRIFVVLPFEALDRMALAQRAAAIGQMQLGTSQETP